MKIKEICDEKILFDNGNRLVSYHDQDCCEEVYADFSVLEEYNVSTKTGRKIWIKEIDFEENLRTLIEGVKGVGFNMISKKGEKFFVPCYNSQNGFYSSDLELRLYKKECETLDITSFVKDCIG